MALAFSHLSWWLWSGKHPEPSTSNASALASSPESCPLDFDTKKFTVKGTNMRSSSTRRKRRKWHSREERKKIDREYDIVLVPSDGDCLSGSESDGSDYSIGWLEPHGLGFQSEDETSNSFAVLVRCYDQGRDDAMAELKNSGFGGIQNVPDNYLSEFQLMEANVRADHTSYMKQWLSSLQNN